MATIQAAIRSSKFVEELQQTDAQEFWLKAIAAVRQLCLDIQGTGILLTHNPQVLTKQHAVNCLLLNRIETWIFTPSNAALLTTKAIPIDNTHIVQLAKTDALVHEWFVLLLTDSFNILVVSSPTERSCLFSLHPEAIKLALAVLTERIRSSKYLKLLQTQLQEFPLQLPPYEVMAKFSSLLATQSVSRELPIPEIPEVEIIKAIAHEVKTPLTTIRTLVHSLLRHKDSSPAIKKRLKQIERECIEQVERFDLIFEAAQLAAYPLFLEATDINDILQENLVRWEEQALRRQLSLTVGIAEHLPPIFSDPKLLGRVLNGLVDRLTRSLPAGSHIQIQATAAGEHLKLQFQSHLENRDLTNDSPLLKAVGQWLMLQPDTGTLSLSLPITKTLFQALGGKFTVRLHPTPTAYDGEILTIFLPFAQP